ncbi:MAG TPA: TRAP transporter permease [Desulfobacteraceae bacterium]|nr:TRAP transporter permease [Desulfobacteraceae bacterium]
MDKKEKVKFGGKRRLRGILSLIGTVIAVALALFQLYTAGFGALTAMFQRGIHLMLILGLVFLYYPVSSRASREKFDIYLIFDLILFILSFVVVLYIIFYFDQIIWRQGDWTTMDVALGIVAVLLVVESARRVIGSFMSIICVIFVVYAYLGPHMPGILGHKGYNIHRIIGQLYLTTEGLFGLPLGVAATFVYLFVLFGSFLEGTGGGAFFTRFAYSLTGRMVGGPAKTAVIASGFMGSVSGSAVANVVTTGSFTIPMMKRTGYKPHVAGGIEAAASTGGQLMPPIMGAGAFLMAEFTNTSYLEIVKIAIIPACMYYFAAYCFVHLRARKMGIKPLSKKEIPDFWGTIKSGYQFFLPIAVLVFFLVKHYSPMMVGFVGVISVVAVSFIRKETRLGFRDIVRLLEKGSHNAVMVSAACGAAGIIVGMVTLTGLGLKFSSIVLSFAGGIKGVAIVLVGIAALFLGMGLPVTAAYIVLVILAGPALMEMGMVLITAHMVVFWYSQTSNVTPPVALASFAAAGVAESKAMPTAWASCAAAAGIYVIPILMAYRPLLLNGPPFDVVIAVLSSSAGLMALSSVLVGFLARDNTIIHRVLLGIAALALFVPYHVLNAGGGLLLLAVFLIQKKLNRKEIKTPS